MIAVLIPALNAARTLAEVISRVKSVLPAGAITVVDDGSKDNTAQIALEAGAHVIRHAANSGKGAALRSGFEHILKEPRYECVITLDADLQHEPREIREFLARWERGGVDVIVGYRKRLGSGMPVHRMLSNVITSFLVSARSGAMIKDSQCGFRCLSREVISAVKFESNGFEAETEILMRAARKGYTIDFVPISTIYGAERSAMTHWQTTRRFLQVLMKEH